MKYILEYECAHFCGDSNHVVVNASDYSEAEKKASAFMEDHMRDLYSDEYADSDGEYDDESAYHLLSNEKLTPDHEHWKYYMDPSQSEFYPEID